MIKHMIAALATSLALATPVWADSNRPADIQTLRSAEENLARAQQGAGKPGQTQAAQRQREEVQKLLDRLEAGQNVPPAEIERVLRNSQHPY